MLTIEQRKQFSDILDELGKTLDITEAQHDAAVRSYEFVGSWLSDPASPLSIFKPVINPHGSFLLGTVTQPIHEEDELDVDLVCRLQGKQANWTQGDLKKIIGDRIKEHGTLMRLLRPEGRRCWTLGYAESARFHLDILPAIVSSGYGIILEKAFSAHSLDVENLAIRITDKQLYNYRTETSVELWLKSNPFGYAIWFEQIAQLSEQKLFSLREAINPVPAYQPKKQPLKRIVQILKRHRDLMFNGDENKPISIIITTLAARAYRKQTDIAQGLIEVIADMEKFIEERYDHARGRSIKWVPNPVNQYENFADKWPDCSAKQVNFYRWLAQVKLDVNRTYLQKGMYNIQATMSESFGRKSVEKTFSAIGERARTTRENGGLSMAAVTGIISNTGRAPVLYHNNAGKNA